MSQAQRSGLLSSSIKMTSINNLWREAAISATYIYGGRVTQHGGGLITMHKEVATADGRYCGSTAHVRNAIVE